MKDQEPTDVAAVLTAMLTGLGSKFWWASEKGSVHEKLVPHVRWLQNNQAYRHINNMHFLRLYGNYEALGMSIGTYARPKAARTEKVAINVVKSCIDTITAKIGKNRPACSYVTEDGDSALRRRTRKRNDFSRGAFYQVNAYRLGPQIVRDGCTFGTGMAKVFSRDGRLCAERIFIDELYVDDVECLHGDPKNMFHVKPMPRAIAIAELAWKDGKIDKDAADAIKNAPRADSQFVVADRNADMIEVYEGWHLRSHAEAGDGRHVIVVNGHDLVDEEWERDRFPFAKWVWTPPQLGFFGSGLAEELNGLQLEINFIAKRIQESFRLCGYPFVFVEDGSKFNTAALKNVVGQVHTYRGTKPEIQVFQTVHPEMFSHLQFLINQAFQTTGVSMADAQSKNPLGKNASGEALRAWDDLDSERFMDKQQRYEEFFEDLDSLLAEEAAELASQNGGKFEVVTMGKKYGRRYVESIPYADIDLGDRPFQVKVFPISSLPDTPAEKIQTLNEMKDSGMITAEDAIDIMDLPDLDKVRKRVTAAINDLDETMDDMIEGGKYQAPEPIQLMMGQAALKRVADAYFEAKRQDTPDQNLEKLRTWMTTFQKMLSPPGAVPQGPPPAAGPPPSAPPQAAPPQ